MWRDTYNMQRLDRELAEADVYTRVEIPTILGGGVREVAVAGEREMTSIRRLLPCCPNHYALSLDISVHLYCQGGLSMTHDPNRRDGDGPGGVGAATRQLRQDKTAAGSLGAASAPGG